MNFHRNDSQNKVADYCKEATIHFEYTDFWDKDEETFKNAKNKTSLKKRLKQKITTMGGKGKSSEKAKKLEEEEVKNREEDGRRLAQEAEINFEYTDFWDKDEATFRSEKNITSLKKRFK